MLKKISLALFVIIALFVVGCAEDPCPEDEVQAYLDATDPTVEAFDETVLLAGSTPRYGLTTVITEMQSIKREYANYEPVPECAAPAHESRVEAMERYNLAFTAFLSQEDDATVSRLIDSGDRMWETADDDYDALLVEAGLAEAEE